MSAEAAVEKTIETIDRRIGKVAAFRATITEVDGNLVQIRHEGAVNGGSEQYASLSRFLLAVDDVVLCIPQGGKPVIIDVIRRAVHTPPTILALAAAGSTATAAVGGDDSVGQITVNPNGSGITTGDIFDLSFAVAKPDAIYTLLLTPASGAARTLGGVVGRSARTTAKVTAATATALTSGSTYLWDYEIRQHRN